MRIAIDIDSTLHHYWDVLADVAKRRFGIDLPYEEQHTWAIERIGDDELRACVRETHAEPAVLAAVPYPNAVATVNAWHDAGHFIHVTSHRAQGSHDATRRWLERIGLRFDDLHCSYDKIARCVALGIDVLIDDSPDNLQRGRDAGMVVATLRHPWNREACAQGEVICADDWRALAAALEPVLRNGAPTAR